MSEEVKSRYKLTILIPTYKREVLLFECLESLNRLYRLEKNLLGNEYELIIGDDEHNRNVEGKILLMYPWAKYLKSPQKGPARNRNFLARNAHSEWIIFIDDDCLAQKGWIEGLEQYFDKYQAVEGRVSSLGLRQGVDYECPSNEHGGYFWSCNIAIKKDSFFKLGGFDERFPSPAMEDVELYARLKKSDMKFIFAKNALVLHPWRKRNGIKFLREKANSIAFFCSLHPEYCKKHNTNSAIKNSYRKVKEAIRFTIMKRNWKGFGRALILDLYLIWKTWILIRVQIKG